MLEEFTFDIGFSAVISKSGEAPESGDWIIEGFAATSDLDFQNDEITPEGLEDGATTLRDGGLLLFNHDPQKEIGKILDARVKGTGHSKGIWIKALVYKTAGEIWKKVKEGILNRFSIQGTATASVKEWLKGKAVNALTKLRLKETSLVSVPANPEAKLLRYYVAKSAEAAFFTKFNPQDDKWTAEVTPLTSDKRTYSGMVKVSPELVDEIISALQKVPTVCLNGDSNMPIGVVDEVSKVDENTVYMKIRYSSDFENPEGKVVIQGTVTKSVDGILLGFTPHGVSLSKELNMPPGTEVESLKAELAKAVQKIEDTNAQMMSYKKELEALKAAPIEPPKDVPVEEKKEFPPVEEEKKELPPAVPVPTEEKKEFPPKKEEEEKPKVEEPSSQSDIPTAPAKDEYPKPPVEKEADPKELMQKIALMLSGLNKAGLPEEACKAIEEMTKLSAPFNVVQPKPTAENTDNVSEGLTALGKSLKVITDKLLAQDDEVKGLRADLKKQLDVINAITVTKTGAVKESESTADVFKNALFR